MDNRRTWTPDDDTRLETAVTALASATLPRQVSLWSAVCGRLAPELTCTPDAAKARYRKLVERRREAAEEAERQHIAQELALEAERAALEAEAHAEGLLADLERRADELPESREEDAWERTCRLVEQYEADQADRIEALLESLSLDMQEVVTANKKLLAGMQNLLLVWQ